MGPQGTGRGLDDPGLDPWLDEVTRAHPEVDRNGLRGIWDYTTDNGYDTMNNAMRGDGPIDPAVQNRIDATNRGLDQLPNYEGTTYRGTNLPDSVVDQIKCGGKYSDRAFSSHRRPPRRVLGRVVAARGVALGGARLAGSPGGRPPRPRAPGGR